MKVCPPLDRWFSNRKIAKGYPFIGYVITNKPPLSATEREVFGVFRKNKTTIKTTVIVILLLLFARDLRYGSIGEINQLVSVAAIVLRNVIHVSLLVAWCISLHRRLLNPQIRTILVTTGALMVLWLLTKAVKYEFLVSITDPIGRYIWYSWYIPMLLIPLFGLFVVHYIGKPEGYRTPKWMKALLITAFLLIGLVLTNDLHQLVFRFYNGFANYDKDYSYGIPYFVLMAWYILFTLYFVIALLRKCRVPGSKKMQKLPLVIAICGVVFWTVYVLKLIKVDLTVIDCLIIASLLESAIQSGMIPSNTNYQEIFSVTTVPIQVLDEDYQPHYVSAGALPVSEAQLRQSADGIVDLGDTLLSSAPIKAGRVVWQDDVRRINELRQQLQDTQEQLSEEGILIQAETEVKENRAKADEQNQLYDRIAREVEPQLIKADELLRRIENEPENTKALLSKVCVIGSYIKRRGNLLLLGEENNAVNANELEYCIRESIENLHLGGVYTSFASDCSGKLPIEHITAAYDFYETLTEQLLDDVTAMLVNLTCKNGNIKMNIQMGCTEEIAVQTLADVTLSFGNFTYEIMDEDVVVNLTIEGGADK